MHFCPRGAFQPVSYMQQFGSVPWFRITLLLLCNVISSGSPCFIRLTPSNPSCLHARFGSVRFSILLWGSVPNCPALIVIRCPPSPYYYITWWYYFITKRFAWFAWYLLIPCFDFWRGLWGFLRFLETVWPWGTKKSTFDGNSTRVAGRIVILDGGSS